MKTSCLIRNILLAGSISLTLASCGGGGGGGGDSSSTGSGSGSTSENTQQEKVEIPQQLTASMSLILEINGEPRQFDIKSATQCVDVANGAVYTVSYVRTGTKTATMTLTSADGTPYKIKLTLTSAKQGSFEQEDGKSGNFTMNGINSGSDNGNSGETVTPDDTPSDDELAPNSLPVGKVLEFMHRGTAFYQYEIVSEDAVIFDGKTCSVEYRKTGDNSAKLIVKAGQERVWELTFLDEESGNAQYNGQGIVYDEYIFRISEKGTSAPPSDDNDFTGGDDGADDNEGSEEDDETEEDKMAISVSGRTLCLQAPGNAVGSMVIRVGDRLGSSNVCSASFSFGSASAASSKGTVTIKSSTKGSEGWEKCDFVFHINESEISEEVGFNSFFIPGVESEAMGEIIGIEPIFIRLTFNSNNTGTYVMEPTSIYFDDSDESVQTSLISSNFFLVD